MNDTLYRLIYISRNEITGDEAFVRGEINQILATARIKNPGNNITGSLMFNAGCFAQVLEGAHDDIQNTFERIQCDIRHSHVVVLAFEPTANRSFANWSMAYQGPDSSASAKFADITQTSGFDPANLDSDDLYALLTEHLFEAEVGKQ